MIFIRLELNFQISTTQILPRFLFGRPLLYYVAFPRATGAPRMSQEFAHILGISARRGT